MEITIKFIKYRR